MIVGAAFCPHPPALIPEVGVGMEPELGALRLASVRAVGQICAQSCDQIVLLGVGPQTRNGPIPVRPSRRGFVVDDGVDGGGNADGVEADLLPLPVLVGAWLLEAVGEHPPVSSLSIGPDGASMSSAIEDLRAIGALATSSRVGLVVLGDGSARRSERAPGYIDERAAGFDDIVLSALGSGDPAELANLDADLGAQLLAAGVPAWRAAGQLLRGAAYDATVSHVGDPFGVRYVVATWLPLSPLPLSPELSALPVPDVG